MKRGFYWSSKAYYVKAADCNHEIMFGDYGNGKEMKMRWVKIGGRWYAKLEVFDEAWATLFSFTDLTEKLAGVDRLTEEDSVKILLECGFEDLTTYDDPYGPDVAGGEKDD